MDASDTKIHVALAQDVGKLEGTVAALDTRVVGMDAKLDRVLAHIEGDKGSKRAWSTVGAIGGAIAGALGGIVSTWFTGRA